MNGMPLGRGPVAAGALAVSSPAPVGEWTQVWRSAPGALVSQLPAWLRCVCEVGGWEDASRLYRTPDGRRLVMPLVQRRLPGGAVTIQQQGLPDGWGPGGLLGEEGIVRPDDVRLVMSDLARGHVLRVQVRPDPTAAAVWADGVPPRVQAIPRMSQSVFLTGGFETVWKTKFRSDTRNRIRKAERAGVVVSCDVGGRTVPTFQDLYAQSVDRWATRDGRSLTAARERAARREPPRKLATVAAALGERCRIYTATVDGQPAAAIVTLWGDTSVSYWRGAMDEQLAGRTYANYLLHHTAIKEAAEQGHLVYHMGESAPGSSLALFKSRFGAPEQPYHGYRTEHALVTQVARARRRVRTVLALRPGRSR